MKDSFVFYRSFFEVLKEVPTETKINLINAMAEFALNDVEVELNGMEKALFVLIKPQLEANSKRYNNGKKGGRPTRQQKGEEKSQECKFAPDSIEVENFIDDFKTYKNADFEPTTAERKNIAIVLSELDGYKPKYWQKVFTLAKAGYLIDGQNVPCNLRKILLEHNSIYAGEANLAPNKELIEERKKNKKQKQNAVEQEYRVQADFEREEREKERTEVKTAGQAVEFLNKYVHGSVTVKRISSDFKEFSKLFGIEIDKDGKFYAYDTSE